MRRITLFIFILIAVAPAWAQQPAGCYLPIGLFFGKIEEGARIFTPVRFLPFDHPEAQGHQFPNALAFHGTELPTLLWLGRQAGLELWATLTRYPGDPDTSWPYTGFAPPDTSLLRTVTSIRRPASDTPLHGLTAVLFENGQLVSFIVDTRNLTLEERGMKRATSMGLELTRAEFFAALEKAKKFAEGDSTALVLFRN